MRNHARILQAADAIFAAEGPSASTDEVARRAGVAIGTVGVPELITLMIGASRSAQHASRDPHLRARALEIVFDGLRPRP